MDDTGRVEIVAPRSIVVVAVRTVAADHPALPPLDGLHIAPPYPP